MKKRLFIFLLTAAMVFSASAVVMTGCDEGEPDTATPDSAETLTVATVDETEDSTSTDPVPPKPPEPPTDGANVFDEENDEEMDIFETFPDLPTHFVTHGGRPGEEGASEYYLHATLEIGSDGSLKGEFFANLESTETETIEHVSNWTGKIRDNKVYKDSSGNYYFFVFDIKYENEPITSETIDGKTVNYVYGYGLDPEAGNRVELFAPGTAIDSLKDENSQQDIRQFLTMMQKDGEADTLDCYMLRGRVDNCYVSITDEQANMAPPEQSGAENQESQQQPQQ